MKITREIVLSVPNLLSALRIILIPLFLYLVFLRTSMAMFWGLAVFCIASLTDLIDGWSAQAQPGVGPGALSRSPGR